MGLAALASGYTRSRLVDDEQTQAGDADVVTLADLLAVLPGATASAAAAVQSALFDAVAQVEDLLNRASAAGLKFSILGLRCTRMSRTGAPEQQAFPGCYM